MEPRAQGELNTASLQTTRAVLPSSLQNTPRAPPPQHLGVGSGGPLQDEEAALVAAKAQFIQQ